MIHSLAVTTDFSPLSRAAFPAAAALARAARAKLHVLHVAQPPRVLTPWEPPEADPALAREREAEALGRLRDLVSSEKAFQGLRSEPRVLPGGSADAIRLFQEREELELIVIASHGHDDARHFLLGSFTSRVLEHVSCPVLVIHAAGGKAAGGTAPREFAPARILAAHDFSRASAAGLEAAREWARDFGASAKLLYVADDRPGGHPRLAGPHESVAEYFSKVQADARSRLEDLIRAGWSGVKALAAARTGNPAKEILAEAREWKADLIVIAGRGLSAIERLSLGSVAERVIQGADCPVLVVKGKTPAAAGALLG